MRKILFNLHLYAAMIAGGFIAIFGITGSIMAFEPEIDHLFHWKLFYVTPRGHALSLAEISALIEKGFPGARIGGYGLSTSPDISYQVETGRGSVFLNQYTGEILGVRQGPDFMDKVQDYVHGTHLRLAIMNRADPGKKIMSWAGVIMLFLLLSGLYLWWPYKRVNIQWSGPAIRRWFDVHAAVGIFSFVFLLVLTITGVVIGFENTTTPLLYKITGSQPPNEPEDFALTPPQGARPITLDQALKIARAALPGATPFEINVPEPKAAYHIRLRYPEDRTPGGRSQVIVDQYDGKVLRARGSRTAPAGARMVIGNRAIHTGDMFGIPSKTIMSLASLMSVVQVASGVLMWWKRKKPRTSSPPTETGGRHSALL
jgi:uncharacterized iron-regulated membrane protein